MICVSRVKFFLVTFLIISLFFAPTIFAQSESTQEATLDIKVNHVAGKFEKLQEKILLFLKFDKKSKAEYLQTLAEKRLAELAFVVADPKQRDLIEPAASRYTTYAGNLTNYVSTNKITEEKEDTINLFERHTRFVDKLQKKTEVDSGWWIAIGHGVNALKEYKSQIQSI